MSFKLGGSILEPGELRRYMAPLGTRSDGSPLGVPIIGVMGMRPGPVLGIIAGIHGDEYEGPEAVRLLCDEIDPAQLSGGIICTPEANVTAYEAFDRTSWIDHMDLNRSFPGRRDGFLTQRVAATLVSDIIEQADFMMDLHSAGLTLDLVPYIGFNSTPGPTGEASFEMAKAFGLPVLYGSTPFPNVTRLEAAQRNIPAILVEVGGEGRCQPDKVALMKRGLENVLRHLGMLDGDAVGLPKSYLVVQAPPEGEFTNAPTGGFLRSRVRVGQRVRAGELLGTIVNVYGDELARIEARLDGLLLSCRTIPVIRTGEWDFSVVKVIAEVNRTTPMSAAMGGQA